MLVTSEYECHLFFNGSIYQSTGVSMITAFLFWCNETFGVMRHYQYKKEQLFRNLLR